MTVPALLLRKVFGDDKQIDRLTLDDWEFVIESLRENASLARFAYHVQEDACVDIPQQATPHLQSELIRAMRQKQQALYECRLIDKHMREIGVTPVFLKGAAYSISDSQVGHGRLYGDIDVLVKKQDIEKSKQVLLERGWFPQTLNDYDEMYYREWAHEIPPLTHLERGTVIDLHHNLVPPISGQAPDVSDFTQDVIETEDALTVFSPAAQTLHSAVHLFLNEDFAHGFRDLTDLHILFTTHRADTVYWERLIELAQASEFEKELQLAIRYCKSLLMTNIPEKYESRIYTLRKTNFTLLDAMFNRVLLPRHPKSDSYDRSFWELLAYMRGHFMKMPFPVLVKHLTIKSWRGLVESTLGKNFYDEAHKQNP
jgi:hypothetical protein